MTLRLGLSRGVFGGMLALLPLAAAAQQPDHPDPVLVFNETCYTRAHNVALIEDLATQMAWQPISGDALEEFKPAGGADQIKAWDLRVGKRLFRLGLSQSALSEAQIAAFPDFAEGKATTCSLILDEQQDPSLFMPNMQSLAGKEPLSANVPDGPFLTTTWAGGNDTLKVFLFAKEIPGQMGGLLNVTLLQK